MDLISILCLVLIYLSAAWCGLIKQSGHIAIFFIQPPFGTWARCGFRFFGRRTGTTHAFENKFLVDPASIVYHFVADLSSVFTRFLRIAEIFFSFSRVSFYPKRKFFACNKLELLDIILGI